jgi:hypothetical protein
MANINLPFEGEVTADNKATIKVINKGIKSWGVEGEATDTGGGGVYGHGPAYGVWGTCTGGNDTAGVVGWHDNWVGTWGRSKRHWGVLGESDSSHGVVGVTRGGNDTAGVAGFNDNWVGVWGKSANKVGVLGEAPVAGRFVGNVEVTGDISLLNADCAENFNTLEENVESGTVMVLTENGSLQQSYQEYDKKVAGIVSGAGGYKPAIVLNSQDSQNQSQNEDQKHDKIKKGRLPIALMGKVYCKVDARHSSIRIGDLLTTSSTKGYAMKAEDPMKAFGAVIGKALDSIKEGLGMIPVLVALQ